MRTPLFLNNRSSKSEVRAILSLQSLHEPSVVLDPSLRNELSLGAIGFAHRRAEPTVILLRFEHRKRVVRSRGWKLPLVLAAVTLLGSAAVVGGSRGVRSSVVHQLAQVHVARFFASSLW